VPDDLIEGLDYTLDQRGRFVFTADYLLKRGECCGSGCQNCPYEEKSLSTQETCGDNVNLT